MAKVNRRPADIGAAAVPAVAETGGGGGGALACGGSIGVTEAVCGACSGKAGDGAGGAGGVRVLACGADGVPGEAPGATVDLG